MVCPLFCAYFDTPYGSIPVKVGSWKGETLTASPEMDACKAAAAEKHVAIREVYQAASVHIKESATLKNKLRD